ncbi:TIGR02536 family ethanolamine utilization protein [Clostridium sp. MSJ-4]|uniref:TIGR02536 family ethanolamine utilization protein n=1 Tax=Clostridium simiarum TaxID=2841506 RepID=A0ABS6F092_9CLOT|nr:TIGR02536 family ethanolamine utilization protein [Clostridium amazonitimonense]MBU5591916.1 TIGR02536 family ethanolamine utilization protein [Clostridium simiarum]
MNKDILVDTITKEVMKRIKLMMDSNSDLEKRVLILEETKDLCPIVKGKIEEERISVDYIDNMKDINSYEFILIQNLSNNELINISRGYVSSSKESVILDLLLKGKKIYALEKGLQYKKYDSTSPKALLEVFKGYKDKLASFGVEFTSLRSILSKSKDCKESCVIEKTISAGISKVQEVDNNSLSQVLSKRLISEVDVRDLKKEGIGEIIVPKKSIVTPLAKDFARVNNIKIKIEG